MRAFAASLLLILRFATATAQEPEVEETGPLMIEPSEAPLLEAITTGAAATFEEQVLELVNQRRLDCDDPSYACSVSCPGAGLAPIAGHWRLHRAAEGHSDSMAAADYFAHNDFTDGCATVGVRITAAGYSWSSLAENIGAGYATPTAVVDGWMASSGHCSAILGSRREVGVGWLLQAGDAGNVEIDRDGDCNCADESPPPLDPCAGGPYGHYWTLDFGNRSGSTAFPLVIEREAHETSSTTVDLYLWDAGGSSKTMRFSNDGTNYSSEVAYAADSTWTLEAGDGVKVVYSIFDNSGATTFYGCDRILLETGGAESDVIFRESSECGDLALGLWDEVFP
jgi:uncharacterized protein YkwD